MTAWRTYLCRSIGVLVLCSGLRVEAAIVRHTLLPNESAFSAQTQHACGVYLLQPGPHWCNPALYSFADLNTPIKADIALNADQDAYDTTNRLLNQPIDREFIEKLFKEQDFQSFSGLVRLEALSEYLSFSFVPVYAMGAYKLSNPSLPEVSAAGERESQFRVTSSRHLAKWNSWNLYSGASLFLYDRKFYYVHANAIDLVVRDIDSLVEIERKRGVDGDVGFFVQDEDQKFPSFGLVSENVFSSQVEPISEDRSLAIAPHFRRRSRVETGYTLSHSTGTYHLGGQLPFWGATSNFDRYGASSSFIYGIGRLRVFTSYSPLMSAFGFMFLSSNYHVGIQYTNDKQDNSLELRRRKNVNLFLSVNF